MEEDAAAGAEAGALSALSVLREFRICRLLVCIVSLKADLYSVLCTQYTPESKFIQVGPARVRCLSVALHMNPKEAQLSKSMKHFKMLFKNDLQKLHYLTLDIATQECEFSNHKRVRARAGGRMKN